jgi:hypothetical protein
VRDFYSTMAQVFPVLMLALIWESGFLERLKYETRRNKAGNLANGVRFWTKRRVRVWIIVVAVVSAAELLLTIAVLVDALSDTVLVRVLVLAGLAMVLGSLLTRAIVDVLAATRE